MNALRSGSANVLGALAEHVSDRVRAAVTEQTGSGGMLPDAVIVIKDQPGRTVDWLAQALGLSQPGAVHLVRKLVELGWVEKRAGADARSHALHLTEAGRRAARRILRARRMVLEEIVAKLAPRQREQLAGIASALLEPPVQDQRSLAHVCRLCDRSRCPACPAHAAYQRRG